MRLAVDASCLAWEQGGIARYLRGILTRLAPQLTSDLHLLVNSRRPCAGIGQATEVAVRCKGGPAWRNGVVLPYLRRTRPDVFWSPWPAAPLQVPCPHAVTIHDLSPVLQPDSKRRMEAFAWRTTYKRTATRADLLLSDSATTTADLLRLWRIDPARVKTVPLGVVSWFRPGDREAAQASVAHRWQVSGPFVLFAGSIEPRKGLGVIVDAANQSRMSGAPMSFVFAGRVAFDPTGVAAQLAATGVCKLLGPVTDQELLELYRAAEVLGVPSEYEGFSLTPLEALACGTPIVIAANSGALSEQFAEVATVAAARTGEAWRAALRQSIERRSALVEPGLAFARRYSWDAAADATLAGLQSIIGRLRS